MRGYDQEDRKTLEDKAREKIRRMGLQALAARDAGDLSLEGNLHAQRDVLREQLQEFEALRDLLKRATEDIKTDPYTNKFSPPTSS